MHAIKFLCFPGKSWLTAMIFVVPFVFGAYGQTTVDGSDSKIYTSDYRLVATARRDNLESVLLKLDTDTLFFVRFDSLYRRLDYVGMNKAEHIRYLPDGGRTTVAMYKQEASIEKRRFAADGKEVYRAFRSPDAEVISEFDPSGEVLRYYKQDRHNRTREWHYDEKGRVVQALEAYKNWKLTIVLETDGVDSVLVKSSYLGDMLVYQHRSSLKHYGGTFEDYRRGIKGTFRQEGEKYVTIYATDSLTKTETSTQAGNYYSYVHENGLKITFERTDAGKHYLHTENGKVIFEQVMHYRNGDVHDVYEMLTERFPDKNGTLVERVYTIGPGGMRDLEGYFELDGSKISKRSVDERMRPVDLEYLERECRKQLDEMVAITNYRPLPDPQRRTLASRTSSEQSTHFYTAQFRTSAENIYDELLYFTDGDKILFWSDFTNVDSLLNGSVSAGQIELRTDEENKLRLIGIKPSDVFSEQFQWLDGAKAMYGAGAILKTRKQGGETTVFTLKDSPLPMKILFVKEDLKKDIRPTHD